MPGDDNYERFVKEDYVETCGYTQSVDGKKLKTPGGTGKEDRELKESLPTKVTDKFKKLKDEPDSDSGKDFSEHHKWSMGAKMGTGAEHDTIDFDDGGDEKGGHQKERDKVNRGYEPVKESVNEAFTSGDRKTLMVIGRDFVQYWDSQFIKGLGKKEIRGLKQGLPQLLSVLGRPEDKRYNRFKTTMRTNPILRKYNDKLLARLSKGFDSERTNVKKKFVDNLIKYSLKESVVKEARRITRGNRGVKVGDTVKFFDRDRNPAHYRGKVKWIMKAKKNKEFVDFIYITAKGNYTDQHLDGTKAYKWHYRRREGVNERVSNSEAKVILSQLGGSKFIAMTGAKNFGVGNEGLSMSIGKNSKRITHFIVDYNRGRDLYNLEFVRMWGGRRISVKKLKGVYFDDLQYNFKRYTGLNTRL